MKTFFLATVLALFTYSSSVLFTGEIHQSERAFYKNYKKASTDNSLEISFDYFSGSHFFEVEVTDDKPVNFDLKITKNKGNLSIYCEDINGNKRISSQLKGNKPNATCENQFQLKKGKYTFVVEGKKTNGKYTLDWD